MSIIQEIQKDATCLKLVCSSVNPSAPSCDMTEDEFLELVRKHQDQVYRHAFYLFKTVDIIMIYYSWTILKVSVR